MDINKRELTFGLFGLAPLFIANFANAQSVDIGKILGTLGHKSNNNVIFTNQEADTGLRQVLSNGAASAILRLGKTDGYWADNLVRIPLPNPLDKVQKSMKLLGLSGSFDDLQLKINRAAEIATPKAKIIFANTIQKITINDAISIVKGGDTAGTQFLKDKTKTQLISEFSPPISDAVQSTGAFVSMNKVVKRNSRQISAFGDFSGNNLSNNLVAFATSKALDGLFYYIGEEERAIRKDPIKQSSDLLRKVFGNL